MRRFIFLRTARNFSRVALCRVFTIIFLTVTSQLALASVSFIGTNIGGGGNGIAVVDVNGDGKLDIIEANNGVTVMLGNGTAHSSPRDSLQLVVSEARLPSATFTVKTQRVSSSTNVTITATLAGTSKSEVLTVTRW